MQDFKEIVPCANENIPLILGKHGETISRLQLETNTRIEIAQGPSIEIIGKPAAIAKAKDMISQLLNPSPPSPPPPPPLPPQDFEGPIGKALRGDAANLTERRALLMKEAALLFERGMKDEGHMKMEEARNMGEQIRVKHAEAATAILKHNNEVRQRRGPLQLDVSGLRDEECVKVTTDRLATLYQNYQITGVVMELAVVSDELVATPDNANKGKLTASLASMLQRDGYTYSVITNDDSPIVTVCIDGRVIPARPTVARAVKANEVSRALPQHSESTISTAHAEEIVDRSDDVNVQSANDVQQAVRADTKPYGEKGCWGSRRSASCVLVSCSRSCQKEQSVVL